MTKRLIFLLLSMLSTPVAYGDLSDIESVPMHYFLLPQLGYHFGYSELAGSNSVSHGPMAQLGLRVERDHFFFTPDAMVQELIGLEKSPITVWGIGFVAGGRLPFPAIDVYLGLTYRTMLSYKVEGAALGRLGVAIPLGLSDFQLWAEGFMGQYTDRTRTKVINYPYLGVEGGVQIPVEL